ncbi:HMCN [Mytilus coruscus]|uniref:HMCN n=1 Tax=Mytilus coruscus TaxID=42192 RepID=A0A6J8AD52_MYTCO|nr:HMCN [Mytilus coruscus]
MKRKDLIPAQVNTTKCDEPLQVSLTQHNLTDMEKLIRVFLFHQTIVTELVGNFLKKQFQPDNFQTFLLNQRHTLFHLYSNQRPCCVCNRNENLRNQQVVRKVQFDLLYVKGQNTCHNHSNNHSCIYIAAPNVKVSVLDVTLAITILKNCYATSLNLQELQSLDDIRKIRNDIAHIPRNSDISENEFGRMWSVLENAALNLTKAFDQEHFNDIKLKIRKLRNRRILAASGDYTEYTNQISNLKDDITESHKRLLGKIDTILERRGLPAIQIHKSTLTATYGDKVVIPCSIESDSTVTYVNWERTSNNVSVPIFNDDRGYQGSTPIKPSLTINFVTFDDAGTYICLAENAAGENISNPVTLIVDGGYLDTDISPTMTNITQGKNITIKCTVSGQPPASSIIWQFTPNGGNAQTINIEDCDGKYTGGSPQNPSLTVTNFQPSDAGSYVCSATNAVGISSSNSPSELCYVSLPVVQIPQNYYIDTYGNQVVIPCSIVSDSTVIGIYWEKYYKNEIERINNGDKGYQGITPTSPSLIINFATSDDDGTYVCHAINAAGKSTSNSTTLRLNGGVLEVRISPISATIINGQNQTINCIVTGKPPATSIIWEFTPNGGTHSLPILVDDSNGKYAGGSVNNPSLTITNCQPADAGSYKCYALNAVGLSSCIIPSVLDYTGTDEETYKRIERMRLSGENCRKTALSYSLLVYTAMRGSLSLEDEYSKILREIAEAVFKVSNVIVSPLVDIIERKLLPIYLKRMENGTYKPRDDAVEKIIIRSFGNECIDCLLKICRFDILFDHVRLRKENKDCDFLEVDAYTLANAFFERMQFDKGDTYLIGEYIRKLGEETDRETLDLFVDILRQGDGDITFYHMDTFLDGLTQEGTDFDVFRKFPTLYDAFYRTVDKYKNTIFHFIVAFYTGSKKYKLYIQHFCKNKFDLLQWRNCDNYTAIDFASFLGRIEVIEFVICNINVNRQSTINRILETINILNTGVIDNLFNIPLNNVARGNTTDYKKYLATNRKRI